MPHTDDWLDVPAWFITFTTYGRWLHGDGRGSVDRRSNEPGMPHRPGNFDLRSKEQSILRQPPFSLGPRERTAVEAAIREVCAYRGWQLLALNVRISHLHVVGSGGASGKRVMNDFKAYATRRLVREGLVAKGRRVWTEGGSVRCIRRPSELERVCAYAIDGQGVALPGAASPSGQLHPVTARGT